MSLTRIGSVGLSTGIDINVGVGTFTGNLTVGGVLTYEDVTNVDSIGLITARNGIKLEVESLSVKMEIYSLLVL